MCAVLSLERLGARSTVRYMHGLHFDLKKTETIHS